MNKDKLVKKDKNSSELEGDDSIPEIKNRRSLRKVLNMEERNEKHWNNSTVFMMTVGEFISVSTGKQTSLECDVKGRYQV